jgi:hypothetical protein
MVREVLNSTAMGTLRGIIQDRYGLGIDLRFIQGVSSGNKLERDSFEFEGHVHFPIMVADRLLATAVIENGSRLSQHEQRTAGELIRLFLEPELFSKYLEQVTSNYEAEGKAAQQDSDESNLVQLNRKSVWEPESQSGNKSLSSNLFVFESPNNKMLFRLASNIHELSGRWAFLNIKDIKSGISNAEDLRSLGTITLFIDDLSQLEVKFQELLAEVLLSSQPDQEPLFIVGSTSPIQTLIDENLISPKLSKLLQTYVMDAERLPKDPRLLQESLEIMMEI